MRSFIGVLFDALVEVLFLLAFKRTKTMHGELQHHRQQAQNRRMKISDAQYEEIKARWTERTRPGERQATNKGESDGI
jgi:uncharacterized membrane protein YqiK